MTASAIVMMGLGLGILWGGFAVCVSIAMKNRSL